MTADRYEVVISPAPAPEVRVPGGPRRPLSPLMQALARLAKEHPGQEARVAEYSSADSARVAHYKLVTGDRAWRRPAGTWEFKHGPIIEGDKPTGKFGVWATFTPPENGSTE